MAKGTNWVTVLVVGAVVGGVVVWVVSKLRSHDQVLGLGRAPQGLGSFNPPGPVAGSSASGYGVLGSSIQNSTVYMGGEAPATAAQPPSAPHANAYSSEPPPTRSIARWARWATSRALSPATSANTRSRRPAGALTSGGWS